MPSLVFDKCCGCIELRSGCLIIGYLNLVFNILMVIMSIIPLAAGSYLSTHAENEDEKNAGIAVIAISAVLLIVFLCLLVFTIVLLVGVHQDKPGHVKSYLIAGAIGLVLSVIVTLAGLASSFNAGTFISRIIGYAISVYFLLVIRSYWLKMDERKPAVYSAA